MTPVHEPPVDPTEPAATPPAGGVPLQILQVIPDFGLGGIQKAGCVVAEAMAEAGHRVFVAAAGDGPRFAGAGSRTFPGGGTLEHRLLGEEPEALRLLIEELQPQIVHEHAAYVEGCGVLAPHAAGRSPQHGTWITPVFGRPPEDRSVLGRVNVCCVGVYTLYRLLRWLGRDPTRHRDRSIIGVPLTPFAPAGVGVSSLDPPEVLMRRRAGFGLPEGLQLVVGRQGRNSLGKWHPRTVQLVGGLLERNPGVGWLSIGMPEEVGAGALKARFGDRFQNRPETSDFHELAEVLAALDVQIFMSKHGECFASSICETAGLAVPTIAFSSPLGDNGQAEQVIDGVTGHLVASEEQCEARVRELMDPVTLTALKRSTREHCLTRWHVKRSAADLVDAYRDRLVPEGNPSDAFEAVATEVAAFARGYRPRVLSLVPVGRERVKLRAALLLAERWSTFRLGRAVKRRLRPAGR